MSEGIRSRVKVSSPFADVRVAPVTVRGSEVKNHAIEIRNDEGDWEVLAIHSAAYNLVPNAKDLEIAEEILIQSGQLWSPEREVWNGKFWARHYRSDLHVDAPQVDDTLALGLRIENSYDRSCQFRIVLMGFVLSCTNGLVSSRHFSSFSMRHIGREEVNYGLAVAKIRQGMAELEGILPLVNRLNRIPLTVDLVSQVANETGLPNREWGEICKLLGGAETAWDLFQCVTHRLSHHGRGRAGLQNEEQVGDYFLAMADGAA